MSRAFLFLGLAVLLTSCNVSDSPRATSSSTVAIAPRIATAQGVFLPVTDSVYIKVSSSDPAKIWYEKALPWSSKFVVVSGLPRGVAFTVVMEGREAHGNGASSAWWRGTQSGTASTAQTVSAQTLAVPVQVLYSPASWKDSVPYGTLLDARDGQAYRSVVIGGRRWMAENLNYRPAGADSGWCYDNQGGNCAKYGRLYTWSQTMAGAASSNAVPSGVRGICPEGWHVPSDGEWADLAATVAALPGMGTANAGTALKSKGGWEPTSGNGTDLLGFRFLPGGNRTASGTFNALLGSGTIASATEASPSMALNRAVMPHMATIYNNTIGEPKGLGLSVRCVQDYQSGVATDSGAFALDASTLGLWRFDEGTGASVVNRVTGKAGALSGGVSWVAGKFGKALKFDGSTGFADLNFDPDERNVTYEVVFTPGVKGGWIFMGWGAYNSGIAIDSLSFASPEFDVFPNSVAWESGKPVYLALTIDSLGNRASVYLNGNLFGSGLGAGHATSWAKLVLGKNAGGTGGFFDGAIDEFRVSKGVRSASAIATLASRKGLDAIVSPSWHKFAKAHGQRYLPSGKFLMGSEIGQTDERPVHEVSLEAFWIDTTEVTQSEFQTLMGRNRSNTPGTNHPVERVSWYDGILFCNARSRRDGFDTVYSYSAVQVGSTGSVSNLVGLIADLEKNGYHLPTEAQWEYAARAGMVTPFHWGRDPTVAGEYAWYRTNSGSRTNPVATKKPNGFGLYDMAGNVWEWTQDWYGPYLAASVKDPVGPATGATKARRGGAWDVMIDQSKSGTAGEEDLRSSFRTTNPSTDQPSTSTMPNVGFRCARGGGGGKVMWSTPVAKAAVPSGNVGMKGLAILNGFSNSCALWPRNSPYTIEFWVKPTGPEATAGFGSYQDLGETRTLAYSNMTTGDPQFRRLQASGWWAFHPDLNLLRVGEDDTLESGQWGHAAFVYTGSQGILYLNGTERVRVTDSRSMECGSSVSLALNAYSAEIDNIRVSRVARYVQNFSPPQSYDPDTSTIYRWTFDGASVDRLKDEVNGVVLVSATDSVVSWVSR